MEMLWLGEGLRNAVASAAAEGPSQEWHWRHCVPWGAPTGWHQFSKPPEPWTSNPHLYLRVPQAQYSVLLCVSSWRMWGFVALPTQTGAHPLVCPIKLLVSPIAQLWYEPNCVPVEVAEVRQWEDRTGWFCFQCVTEISCRRSATGLSAGQLSLAQTF